MNFTGSNSRVSILEKCYGIVSLWIINKSINSKIINTAIGKMSHRLQTDGLANIDVISTRSASASTEARDNARCNPSPCNSLPYFNRITRIDSTSKHKTSNRCCNTTALSMHTKTCIGDNINIFN